MHSGLVNMLVNKKKYVLLSVCLCRGSYFAVLADEAKPLWSMTNQQSISLIADAEMARINIETSAVLEQWLDIIRSDSERYFALVQAAKQLPLPLKRMSVPPQKRECLLEWAFCRRMYALTRSPTRTGAACGVQGRSRMGKTDTKPYDRLSNPRPCQWHHQHVLTERLQR